ncbi:MAG: glycosyl hydrolase family 18 [Lachnospiraceae bacterium]|nr:glycosyl hydrolase family 18 [Lachnospiraceae bacterium]
MSKTDSTENRRKLAPVFIFILVIVLIVLILTISKVIDKYTPTTETMSLDEYFEISSTETGAVIELNNEILEERALIKDGKVYLSYSFIHDNINSGFYYDANENLLLYTTATDLISIPSNSSEYTVAKDTQSEDYTIMFANTDDAYVAVDFVEKYSNMQYKIYSEPSRIVICTSFGDYTSVTASKDTVIRYRGGIKSPILEEVTAGEAFEVLDNEENWTYVASETGVMGYIQNSYLNDEETAQRVSDYVEEEYDHILLDETVNMAWHQVTNEVNNESIAEVLNTTKGVNVISPTWFYLNDDEGNIASIASSSYVTYCHQNGVQVWGLVSNLENEDVDTTSVLTHTSTRTNLVNQIMAAAIQYDLDGINVDFEALESEVGDAFIQFIRELSLKCANNDIILSVDNYVPSEYTAFYERGEQAKFADYVIVMAYDEHYVGSDEGPVASIDFVTEGISNTIKDGVPENQLILGIPFYTRLWIETPKETDGDDVESASEDYVSYELSSQALGMTAAAALASENGVEMQWLDDEGLYYFEYEKDGLTYKVWLEDVTSIALKLDKMKENSLAGAAFWKLGLEDSAVWDTILKYMN